MTITPPTSKEPTYCPRCKEDCAILETNLANMTIRTYCDKPDCGYEVDFNKETFSKAEDALLKIKAKLFK